MGNTPHLQMEEKAMTKKEQQRVKDRDDRLEKLIAYCKMKYKDKYTPQLFDIYYAGYDLCRRKILSGRKI